MLDQAENPFANLDALRISQDFSEGLGVKKVIVKMPVRKPDKQIFFRVHPEFSLEAMVLEIKEDREYYFLMPSVREYLFDEARPVRLYVTVDRQGNAGIWPCKLPGPDGRSNPWFDTAIEVAEMAKDDWVRLIPNQVIGGYEALMASGELSDPTWPDKTFEELLHLAFKDRMVNDLDHPVIRRLKGVQ
jgi:hypothetical protein